MASLIELNGVQKFDPNAKPSQLNQSWKRWHRSFELFAVGKEVSNPEQRKALLLHFAGPEVQDIYNTLNEVRAEQEDSVYTVAVKTLNKHFENKVNVPYERAKLLEKGKDLTLEQLRTIAATFEMTEAQARHMDTELVASINKIHGRGAKTDKPKRTGRFENRKYGNKCFRCGREGHLARDQSCPAKDKECRKCGNVGHFMSCCLTKPKQGKRMAQKSQRGGQIHTVESESDSDVFAFILKTSDKSSDKVTVSLGGHRVEFAIDSGASATIIDKELTTGVSPAELMFRRKLRTKLPQIENLQEKVLDEEMRDKDVYSKYRNKLYVDEKRCAVDCDLEPGDSVLLKKEDKIDTPYHAEPYTLVQKTENSCVVESPEGVTLKRNSEFVKKYQEPRISESDVSDIPETYSEPIIVSADTGDEGQPSVREPIARKPTEPVLRRSTRVKTVPQHFKDFKM
uniref:CCHC-type domain-containing protein n=1 Tax=Magallana gigas TaxID=29159 RepID=A0A8W8NRV4_MAGGI